MSLDLHVLTMTLWALVIVSEGSLLYVLLWRKAWRTNPAFIAFIALCVLRSGLLLVAKFVLHSTTAYAWIWWVAYIPQSVILTSLLLEVMQIIFRPFEALPRGTLSNFAAAVFSILLLVVAFTIRFPGSQPSEWATFLRAMDQGVSWVLLGVFAVISVCAGLLGVPWNHRVYGIVVGFTFYLSVDVAVVTIAAQISSARNLIWPCDMAAFLLACGVWFYYFLQDEVPVLAPKIDEVRKIAAILSHYVFVIESLEMKKAPHAPDSARRVSDWSK